MSKCEEMCILELIKYSIENQQLKSTRALSFTKYYRLFIFKALGGGCGDSCSMDKNRNRVCIFPIQYGAWFRAGPTKCWLNELINGFPHCEDTLWSSLPLPQRPAFGGDRGSYLCQSNVSTGFPGILQGKQTSGEQGQGGGGGCMGLQGRLGLGHGGLGGLKYASQV